METTTEVRLKPPPSESVQIHEPLVRLPDRNILVIGTEHGLDDEPFTGRSHVEQEIAKIFGTDLSALVMDSMIDLNLAQQNLDPEKPISQMSYSERSIYAAKKVMDKDVLNGISPVDSLPFIQWAIRQAIQKQIPLIALDPVVTSLPVAIIGTTELYNSFLPQPNGPYGQKIDAIKNSREYRALSEQQEGLEQTMQATSIENTIPEAMTLLGVGMLILTGLKSKNVITRRGLLKGFLGLGGASLAGLSVQGFRNNQARQNLVQIEHQKGQLITDIYQQKRSDVSYLKQLSAEARELNNADYSTEQLQRMQEEHAINFVTACLRNVIAAEMLTLPLSDILPNFDTSSGQKPNIATIWGAAHLALPEKYRISYLLTHEQERKLLLTTLLSSFLQSAQELNKKLAENPDKKLSINLEEEKENLKKFGKTFSLSSQGTFTTHQFSSPSINQIIDQS